MVDRSNGYEAVAHEYMKRRSEIGAQTIREWAKTLPQGAAVLDLGCGHGVPISRVLIECGCSVYAVDASRHMVEAFRRRFPDVPVAHEAVEESSFFDRSFDAVVAIGLVFLLKPEVQVDLIHRVAAALNLRGRFLFTSPEQACNWSDVLTGRPSQSLGREAYQKVASNAGLTLIDTRLDEGDNHYFDFLKQ